MNRMKMSAVIMLAAVCAVASGCGEVKTGNTPSAQSESAVESVTESTEPKYSKEYDEEGNLYLVNNRVDEVVTPFPEGWSAERLSKMVTIDGYQISFPCKISDILALSEDFRLDEAQVFDYGDGTSSYQIWYKDDIVLSGIYIHDNNLIKMMTINANDFTKYEGVDSNSPNEITNLFSEFTKGDSLSIFASYFENDKVYHIVYSGTNAYSSLALVWEEI